MKKMDAMSFRKRYNAPRMKAIQVVEHYIICSSPIVLNIHEDDEEITEQW